MTLIRLIFRDKTTTTTDNTNNHDNNDNHRQPPVTRNSLPATRFPQPTPAPAPDSQ
ncbi:MAG: hypothetical protein IPM52_00070 [Bacteroidetes bacterium]|nr:hypothetical protein [Bacteroidota bacterium]